MSLDGEYKQVVAAIMKALDHKMEIIGETICDDAVDLIIQKKWYDTRDFERYIGHEIVRASNRITLKVGSKVDHAPFFLGGKEPSWTPLKPIKAWVERKNLSWVDKKTGSPLTVAAMAMMIIHKIRREGIKPRNIFKEVFAKRQTWIYDTLESLEG